MGKLLGIDIGGTSIKWAVVSEGYEFGERGSVDTPYDGPEALVDALARLAEPWRGGVEGIGISAPGGINSFAADPDGTIHRGGALTFMDGVPLGRLMRERCNLPVTVANDGKCCALGEYAAGALAGTSVGCVLAIGTGIGGGIVVDGRVLTGATGFAGEFSFLSGRVDLPFEPETCFAVTNGWRGLRALVADELGIVDEAELEQLDGRRIFAMLAAGASQAATEEDAAAAAAVRRGLDRYAELFDRWLVNLQCVIDPEVFAIGGGISGQAALFEAFERQMDGVLARYTGIVSGVPRPRVVPARLGNDANIYGAVATCLQVLGR